MATEYIVTCDCLELPKGSRFTTLPGAEVRPGQLVLLEIFGYLIPGRWSGNDSLQIPGLLLKLNCPCRIIGPVVTLETGKAYPN